LVGAIFLAEAGFFSGADFFAVTGFFVGMAFFVRFFFLAVFAGDLAFEWEGFEGLTADFAFPFWGAGFAVFFVKAMARNSECG